MPVPPGFCVAASVYSEHAERCGLTDALPSLIEARDWATVEKTAIDLLLARPLDPTLLTTLSSALRCLDADTVAVRSSAIAEDLAEASFAGQYRTLLNVRAGEDLQRAVGACWASLWCRSALEYRHRRSIDQNSGGMALVIQPMVPADAAGVLFTVDPVAQRSDRILIEAVAGLGEALVSGGARDVVYRVDRATLDVVDREGTTNAPTVPRTSWNCAALSLEVEGHFGCPQDIEFVLSRDGITLVQTRPITTLGHAVAEPLDPLPDADPQRPTDAAPGGRALCQSPPGRWTTSPTRVVWVPRSTVCDAAARSSRAEDEAAFRGQIWHQAYRFPPHRLTWRILFHTWRQLRLLRTDWLQVVGIGSGSRASHCHRTREHRRARR